MLFLDNATLYSCCAKRPLHIPTYPHLVSTAATVREKTCGETHKPNDRPTTITFAAHAQRRLIIMYSFTISVMIRMLHKSLYIPISLFPFSHSPRLRCMWVRGERLSSTCGGSAPTRRSGTSGVSLNQSPRRYKTQTDAPIGLDSSRLCSIIYYITQV